MRWWEEVFRDEDAVGYRSFHVRQDRGRRPALVMIDVVRSFVGNPGLSLEEAVAEWPTACGPMAYAALPAVADLLAAARAAGIPIAHTRPDVEHAAHYGDTVKGELAGDYVNGRPGATEFAAEARPLDGELVISKPKASAFFETPLGSHLARLGVDSVLLAGCTTSGCVRASAVDSFSWGFPTFVVEEAVFDRSRLSGAVSLYELDAKYADVLPLDEVRDWLSAL